MFRVRQQSRGARSTVVAWVGGGGASANILEQRNSRLQFQRTREVVVGLGKEAWKQSLASTLGRTHVVQPNRKVRDSHGIERPMCVVSQGRYNQILHVERALEKGWSRLEPLLMAAMRCGTKSDKGGSRHNLVSTTHVVAGEGGIQMRIMR